MGWSKLTVAEDSLLRVGWLLQASGEIDMIALLREL
jgi:hypothetical protein